MEHRFGVELRSRGAGAFRAPRVRNSGSGVFTFTVTGIALSGYTYDPNRNVETSDSISR